jgi:hypothetical protein
VVISSQQRLFSEDSQGRGVMGLSGDFLWFELPHRSDPTASPGGPPSSREREASPDQAQRTHHREESDDLADKPEEFAGMQIVGIELPLPTTRVRCKGLPASDAGILSSDPNASLKRQSEEASFLRFSLMQQ